MMSTKRWLCSDNHIVGYVGCWQQIMFKDHHKNSRIINSASFFFFFFFYSSIFLLHPFPGYCSKIFIKVAFCNQSLKKPEIVSHYVTRSLVNYNPGFIFKGNWSWIYTDLPSIQPRLADPLRTSVAHSWMIPIAGKMTSSCPLTNKEASIGNAPAARMAWMFFRHLLQLHNAIHVWWVSLKSSSPLGAFLWRRLLSGWRMLTWEK